MMTRRDASKAGAALALAGVPGAQAEPAPSPAPQGRYLVLAIVTGHETDGPEVRGTVATDVEGTEVVRFEPGPSCTVPPWALALLGSRASE